jgi:two-component system, sensor histidine kinase and response regulator
MEAKILLVDDNPRNLQVLANALEPAGYQIVITNTGKDAIETVHKEEYDLILLDIMMPELDGFETCNQIKALPTRKHIPIIFLTAKDEVDSITKGFRCGGVDYITKPFNTEELIARVNTHIKLKQTQDKLLTLNMFLDAKVTERTRELMETNEKLVEAHKTLDAMDQTKTEFLHLLSHEIRTPLNGIINPLAMLKENPDPKEFSNLIDILDQSVKRLERFSTVALQITRLRMNKETALMKEPFDLSDLVAQCLMGYKTKLKEKSLQFVQKGNVVFPIMADSDYIKVCILNVLENAVQFAPANTNIDLTMTEDDVEIQLTIRDYGKGFSDRALTTIFKPFGMGQAHVNVNVGLGLYLSKMIMDTHKGSLEIKNCDDGGALVILRFPKST